MPIWHFKFALGWTTLPTLRFHRAGYRHAFQRPSFAASRAVNIEIMRAFVRLRQLLATHADLARRINEMESKFDKQFAVVFDTIRKLIKPPEEPPQEMGYHTLMPKKK